MEQNKNPYLTQDTKTTYEDDYVLITFSQGFGETICVLAGATCKSKAVRAFDGFYGGPKDILDAYEEVLDPKHWGMSEEEVASHVNDCRDWLIRLGCPAEELE